MQVFRPSNTLHSLSFIPRIDSVSVVLKITNELRSTESTINISGSMLNGVFNGFFTYEFVEGGSYSIEVYDTDSILLFRGKAFATDVEDLQNYKLIR